MERQTRVREGCQGGWRVPFSQRSRSAWYSEVQPLKLLSQGQLTFSGEGDVTANSQMASWSSAGRARRRLAGVSVVGGVKSDEGGGEVFSSTTSCSFMLSTIWRGISTALSSL